MRRGKEASLGGIQEVEASGSLVVEFQSREVGTEPESCSHLWDHGL